MLEDFKFDVFLSHSSKDKTVVRELTARLKKDGVRVWLDEEQIKPGDSIPAKIEEGLEHSHVLVLCMSANAFGSDWAQLEAGTFRFRDPLNKERRFIPLRLDDTPIKGSLVQLHYVKWLPAEHEREYAKLLAACRGEIKLLTKSASNQEGDPQHQKGSVPKAAASLKIDARMVLQHTDKKEILLVVDVVNMAEKIAFIKKVAVVLPRLAITAAKNPAVQLMPDTSELVAHQTPRVIEIKPNGGLFTWEMILRDNLQFGIEETEGVKHGKGYVELTSGKKLDFHYLPLPDSAWAELTAPIAPTFDGKAGYKCSRCGFVILLPVDAITVICPNCQRIADLKSNSTAAAEGKSASAAITIHTAFLRIMNSYEDCILLVEDNNVEKLRDRKAEFQKCEQAFGLAFQANSIYLPSDAVSDIQTIVTDCIRFVRMSTRLQKLIDSKPTEEGRKVVERQYLEIQELEDKIFSLRSKAEDHFRRLIA